MTFESGALIWYRQCRRGGYGYWRDVPGDFVRATPRRVVVRLTLKDGTPVNVAVHPKNVRPRNADDVELTA